MSEVHNLDETGYAASPYEGSVLAAMVRYFWHRLDTPISGDLTTGLEGHE